MDYKKISGIFLIITIIILVYLWYRHNVNKGESSPLLVPEEKDATKTISFPGGRLKKSVVGNEFSYSLWINIEDWGQNFSKPKHVFHVGDKEGKSVSPGVWLYPKNNNLMVRVDTHDRHGNISKTVSGKVCQNWSYQYPHNHEYTSTKYPNKGLGDHNFCRNPDDKENIGSWCLTTDKETTWEKCSDTKYTEPDSMNPLTNESQLDKSKKCDIVNIPVQRWVHIGIVMSNRTLDVYLNGKISRSCTLNNIPIINNGNIYINQEQGFKGSLTGLRYYNYAISPSSVSSLYSKGPDYLSLYEKLVRFYNKMTKESECGN